MGAAAVAASVGVSGQAAVAASAPGVPADAFTQTLQQLAATLPGADGATDAQASATPMPASTTPPAAAPAVVAAATTPPTKSAKPPSSDAADDDAQDDTGDAAQLVALPFLMLTIQPTPTPALPDAPPGLPQSPAQAAPVLPAQALPIVAGNAIDAPSPEGATNPLLALFGLPEEAAHAGDAAPLPTEAAPPTPASPAPELPPLRLTPVAPPAESSSPPPAPITGSEHRRDMDAAPADGGTSPPPFSVHDAAPPARSVPVVEAAPAPAPVAVEQVVSRRVSADGSLREVVVRLDPPELGTVHVRVATQASGEVTTQITTTQPAALELLHQRLPELRAALSMAGLAVGDCSVSLNMTADGQPRQPQAAYQPQQTAPRPPYAPTAPTTAAPVILSSPRGRGRVDSFA